MPSVTLAKLVHVECTQLTLNKIASISLNSLNSRTDRDGHSTVLNRFKRA